VAIRGRARGWGGFYVALQTILMAGCSGSAAPKDFLDSRLTGQIIGKKWDFVYGYIDPTIETLEEDDLVLILLPFKPKDRCPQDSELGPDKRSVMVSVPMVKKVTQLKSGSNRNAVFHTVVQNKATASVVKTGKIKLDSITKRKVRGRIFAVMNDNNWVSGKFSAEVCQYQDFQ